MRGNINMDVTPTNALITGFPGGRPPGHPRENDRDPQDFEAI